MRRPAAAVTAGRSLRSLGVLALVALLSLSTSSSSGGGIGVGVSAAGECNSQPCANGGTCVQGVNSYTCQCPGGFSGAQCGCDASAQALCENGGSCTSPNAPCACVPGYSGFFCEIRNDPCNGNPCGADGTCVDHLTFFTCECDEGVTGNLCQTRIDQCASQPCLNGGTCDSNLGYWTCQCVPGFTGLQCQTDVDQCAGSPCQNGGTCSENGGDYVCACLPGWCGKSCQSDCDECASQPCQNGGTCTQPVRGSFSCGCPAGFSGPTCGINHDDCTPNPCNGPATCIDGANTYTCVCNSGYRLDPPNNCVLDNECVSFPCQNGGTCNDLVNSYSCSCASGWSGPQCQSDIDECASNPCQYGTCTDRPNGYTCACNHPNAVLPNCFLDACSSNPCQMGATCVNTNYGFRCECAANYVGALCQTYVDPCGADLDDCQNGATCVKGVFSHTCYCAPGWNGTKCDVLAQQCVPNPCQGPGATCTELSYGFHCNCPELYWGDRCEFHNNTKLEQDVGSAVPWDNFAGRTGGIIAAIVVFFVIVFCCYKCYKKEKGGYKAYAAGAAAAATKAPAKPKDGKSSKSLTGNFSQPDVVPGGTSASPASAARLLKIRDKVASIDRILAGAGAGAAGADADDAAEAGMSPRARQLHKQLRERAQRIDELSRSGRSAVSGYGAEQIGVSIRVPDDLLAQPSRFPEFDTRLIASAAAALVGTAHNAGGLAVGTGAGGDGDDAQAVWDNRLPELVEKATAEPDGADDANIKLDE